MARDSRALLVLLAAAAGLAALGPCGAAAADPSCALSANTTGFLCKNHHCIAHDLRCNGVNNCGDNSDEKGCPGVSSSPLGFIAAAVASVMFGTNFIPVKKYDTGDGTC
jgi:hypothetical protein